MKIFLTGSTGYLGRFVQKALLDHGHEVVALVRSVPDEKPANSIKYVPGDITIPEEWSHALKNCDAVVHLVSIIREKKARGITFEALNVESTRNLVDAAKQHGINRFIYMSALGAHSEGPTPYFRTKGRAEQIVLGSGLAFTIIRPSFIFGFDHPVYTMLATVIKRSPLGLMPVFGDGQYRHQPVFVENVAEIVAQSLDNPAAEKKVYEVGGPRRLSYLEQLKIIGRLVGKKVRPVRIALGLVRPIVRLIGPLPFSPINSDQLAMLVKDNVCDTSALDRDFDVDWVSFEKGLETMKL